MTARTRTARRKTALAIVLTLVGSGIHVGPVAAVPTGVAFTAQPDAEVVAGSWFPTQPVVHVSDGESPAVGETVTLSIIADRETNFTCTGGLSRLTDAGGNAVFGGCKVDVAGVNYALRATAGAIHADGRPFTVRAGPPASLFFASYPAATTYSRLTPQPVVGVLDVVGNLAVSLAEITLDINRGGSSFHCAGGLTKSAAMGLAEFTGCHQTQLGAAYRLIADDGPGGLGPIEGPTLRSWVVLRRSSSCAGERPHPALRRRPVA